MRRHLKAPNAEVTGSCVSFRQKIKKKLVQVTLELSLKDGEGGAGE